MSIADAISDLKLGLRGSLDEPVTDFVKSVSRDYGLNPIFVDRKFLESTGCTPEEYHKKHKDLPIDPYKSMNRYCLEQARLKAHEYAKGLVFHGGAEAFVGKDFTANNEVFIWIGMVKGNPKFPIKAVRVSTLEYWQFPKSCVREICKQIGYI